MVLCAYMGLKKIRFSRLLFVMSLFSSMYLGIKYGLVLGGANMILVPVSYTHLRAHET